MELDRLRPVDNRDDRTEIFYLLTRLSEAGRREFLEWARDKTNDGIKFRHAPPHILVKIETNSGLPEETYADLMLMIASFGLNLSIVLPELERRVRAARFSCE